MAPTTPRSGSKSFSAVANLANLLPTGTVLVFQALIPTFSNNGKCLTVNKYLTLSVIISCSIACCLSSFTDSFVGGNGKLYYGIATMKGLYIFNKDKEHRVNHRDEEENGDSIIDDDDDDLGRYRIRTIDFVHAISSVMVFLVFAASSSDVKSCFFSQLRDSGNVLMMNLPIGVGALASFLFLLFPTNRRGIGSADVASRVR